MAALDRLAAMPPSNAWQMALTVAAALLMAWAFAGAARVAWDRYPPRWPAGYGGDDLARGRKAWALALVFAGFAVGLGYRAWRLWESDAVLPALGAWVDVFRVWTAVLLVRAFLPRHARGGPGGRGDP